MKKTLILIHLLISYSSTLYADCSPAQQAPSRGPREGALANSIPELEDQFQAIYYDSRRLAGRIFKDGEYKAVIAGTVRIIPSIFLKAIESHIEVALERGYADYAIYADMGHVHLLMPQGQALDLSSPELKLLYHTAELLRLRDGSPISGTLRTDPWLAWRYHARNFVGTTTRMQELSVLFARGQSYNTVRGLPGFEQKTTLYFSSHVDGCFTYQFRGSSYRFDLAFE